MPSTITHTYFCNDLYERMSKDKQKKLENYAKHLKIFAQGPDVLFFYNLFKIKNGMRIRHLGHQMHNNKTQSFFVNLVNEIKIHHLECNPEILSFLYGFIAHYVLDMTMHPYIIYKTGIYEVGKKESRKYFGGHETIEAYFDAYLVKNRAKVNPGCLKTDQFCCPKITISKCLKEILDRVIENTYNEHHIGNKFVKSINQMRSFYKLFRNDCSGIKKLFYKIGQILPFPIKLEAISYNVKLNKTDYYLNTSKQYWHHPLDKNELYNYSFAELYVIAMHKALNIISDVDKVLSGKRSIKYLKQIFPNLSYVSGKDCKLGPGTYFSF